MTIANVKARGAEAHGVSADEKVMVGVYGVAEDIPDASRPRIVDFDINNPRQMTTKAVNIIRFFVWQDGKGFEDLAMVGKTTYERMGLDYENVFVSPDGSKILWLRSPRWQAFGEIGLAGVIKSVSKDKCVLAVSEVFPYNGQATPLSPAREKAVLLKTNTYVDPDIKTGAKALVLGVDSGPGKPIAARCITLNN